MTETKGSGLSLPRRMDQGCMPTSALTTDDMTRRHNDDDDDESEQVKDKVTGNTSARAVA